ncbi:MAG TPA: cytochrome c oxidase subunit 3 [Candidatus Dormibacteraeota bacterium]|nr:cytochrome c oxidase subunit 3 [Candidatus Dormibacteraeota bacterium]
MASAIQTRLASTHRVAVHADATRSGVWVGIFAITMSFAAFTSALFVRQGSSDWTHLAVPPLVYANTLILIMSSITFEMSRRAMAKGLESDRSELRIGVRWLWGALVLGLAFVAGQYMVWRQLAAAGIYLATNPNSSFFYVFTGMHALHLIGGILALVYLIARLSGKGAAFRQSLFESTAIYWHFMAGLWLYLLLVMRTRL